MPSVFHLGIGYAASRDEVGSIVGRRLPDWCNVERNLTVRVVLGAQLVEPLNLFEGRLPVQHRIGCALHVAAGEGRVHAVQTRACRDERFR